MLLWGRQINRRFIPNHKISFYDCEYVYAKCFHSRQTIRSNPQCRRPQQNNKDKTMPSFTATSPLLNFLISQSSLVITQAQWSFARLKMGLMLKRELAPKQQWKQQSTCCFFISLRSQNKCHARCLQIQQQCHISWDKGMWRKQGGGIVMLIQLSLARKDYHIVIVVAGSANQNE